MKKWVCKFTANTSASTGPDTLGRKNTRPFADFSYKTVTFKRLEKYLKITQKS
jgi:hypothetical protein